MQPIICFKTISNIPESVFLHRPTLTLPRWGSRVKGLMGRSFVRFASCHPTTQVVRDRPEASSENTVEKLQQFKQRFQEKIEVCFGVVLLVVFGIVSRWFQC